MADPAADFRGNVSLVFEMLEALRRDAPRCRFLLLSSAAVYGSRNPHEHTDVLTADNLSTAFGQEIALDVVDDRYFARRARSRAAHRRQL